MQQVQEIIGQVTHTLGDIASSDVVVGAPLEVGPVTVVSISRVMAGFGGGGAEGRGEERAKKVQAETGMGSGGGSGGGAVVRPVAVVVFTNDGVEVLPIAEKRGKIEKLLDQLPELMERFSQDKQG